MLHLARVRSRGATARLIPNLHPKSNPHPSPTPHPTPRPHHNPSTHTSPQTSPTRMRDFCTSNTVTYASVAWLILPLAQKLPGLIWASRSNLSPSPCPSLSLSASSSPSASPSSSPSPRPHPDPHPDAHPNFSLRPKGTSSSSSALHPWTRVSFSFVGGCTRRRAPSHGPVKMLCHLEVRDGDGA